MMRLDLDEDPAVIKISGLLGKPPLEVVGMCWKLWSWVSRQCHDESVTDVTVGALRFRAAVTELTKQELERAIGIDGFVESMIKVKWLLELKNGLIAIPNYDRWLAKSAKTRGLATKRQRKHRAQQCHDGNVTMSRSDRDKNVTTVQDRTAEKTLVHPSDEQPLVSLRGIERSEPASPAPDSAWAAPGQTCPVPGQTCPVPGQTCPVPGQTCPVPGQTCPVPGQTWAAPGPGPGPGAAPAPAPAHENGAKTKPKKTPQKFCLTDCEDYQKLPASVQQVITDWMEYKRERNEGYKPTGLKQFVSLVARRVAETRAEVVVEQFRRSMSSGWAGWDFALPAGSEPKPTAPAIYKKPQDYDAALTAELKRAREIREGRDAREYREAREEEMRRQELMRQIRAIEQLAEKETVR
jgi:hypothetical protein